MKQKGLLQTWYIFPVLFIEGASLMGVELIGAKLVAPYYGNSIYVWAAVLSVTLGSLTIGYFLGGKLSMKLPSEKTLFIVLLLAAIAVFIMPFTGKIIMKSMLGFDLRMGIIVSCIVFLLPPLLFFGIVGPMVVRLSTKTDNEIGKTVGKVYFISTLGGIAGTFLYGFYFVPYLGIRVSVYLTVTALILLPIGYLFLSKISQQLINAEKL